MCEPTRNSFLVTPGRIQNGIALLAFMEGNMRGPSSQDCEKSFARTGIPSANMLAKKRTPANLVQIRLAPAGSATQPSGAIA